MIAKFRRTGAFSLAAVAVTAFCAGPLAACGGPSAIARDAEAAEPNREVGRALYAGQPAVVHATEFPVASAAEGIARGDDAWRQGQLDLAVYLYVQSLAFNSDDPAPYLKIAAIHERLGNLQLAETAFERAFALDPDNAGTNERLGLLYLQDGRDDAARARFERAIALDPSRWQSHNGLGIAADRRFNFAAAIAHYDAALAIEPRAAMVANNRGYSRYLARDFAGAEADYRLALALGAQAGTWTNLGKAQARQGRYAEAMESLQKENGEAQAHNLLGECALENDDLDTAQSEFTLALSASPRYFEAARDNLERVNERIAEEARHRSWAALAAGSPVAPQTSPARPASPVAASTSYLSYSSTPYRASGEKMAKKAKRQDADGIDQKKRPSSYALDLRR